MEGLCLPATLLAEPPLSVKSRMETAVKQAIAKAVGVWRPVMLLLSGEGARLVLLRNAFWKANAEGVKLS